MNWFLDLIRNPYLIAGVSAWLVAQVIKTVLYAAINRKMVWERMVGDGGMPSGHSATVTAVCVMCGLIHGLGSFEFAISGILAIIVCHDAMGVRQQAGKHAVVLNELIKAFQELSSDDLPETKLKEFVGHTPVQVIAGILVGVLDAALLFLLVY